MAVLHTVAGLQVPVILLVDVSGNTGVVLPAHIAATCVNNGVILLFTVTVSVAVVAHCPAVGVKVYVPVAILFTVAGLHVPFTLLVEVSGNTGAVLPIHIGLIAVNKGVVLGVTVKFIVTILSQPLALLKVCTMPVWGVV